MIHRPVAALSAAIAALTLSGCAKPGDFPSLAPRAVESEGAGQPVPPPPPAPAEPALAARIAQLRAEAEAGQGAFAAEAPAARAAVAKAGASGSESWTVAQQSVSRLEAARSLTTTALTELDRIAIERASRPTNPDDYEALMAALETARALADAQKAEIERLTGALSGA
ncbi:hypothetical protein [Allosphingosinicella vermicomposti]|uniref:hypothetical protein n=1 Tax=Allosphingosinicella vermicomposti TaxID=614671 RepID=UPI000D0ED617|nr:hypothetical protein [Allosphingosinicella vermicomposti]